MIVLDEVSKVYPNHVHALQGIDLHIAAGEFLFIVGPSGSGKSTLLKLLYREELPSSGQVAISGVNLRTMPRAHVPRLRQRIGVIFQDFKLLPQRTVWENVAFPLMVLGMARRDIDKRVRSALDLTGLADAADTFPHQLSAGEQQRVSIARAIINSPPLLLADEPTGNLDPDNSWEIMRLFTKINLRGTTVLIATHDKLIVDNMRRRVVTLERGQLVHDRAQARYSAEPLRTTQV